jgi:predicted protein tyrosine phosphatase
MKILFVCTGNKDRSPTAEALYKKKYSVQSAGTSTKATQRISQVLIDWADIIIVFTKEHERFLRKNFSVNKPMHSLGIPDRYDRGDPKLVEKIRHRMLQLHL